MSSKRRRNRTRKERRTVLAGEGARPLDDTPHPSSRASVPREPVKLQRQRRLAARAATSAEAERFLAPEQQHLLKARRKREQDEARRRRLLALLGLAAVVIVSAGIAFMVKA